MKRLVKFSSEEYGVRIGCWLFGYKYQDFSNTAFSWKASSIYILDCKTTLKEAQLFLKQILPKVVKN